MPAHITTIADAVVTALNAATFSEPHASVWAERSYTPRRDREELEDKVFVTVRQVSWKTAPTHKDGRKQRDIIIEVGIQRATSFANNDDGDALALLVEEIERLFLGLPLTGVTNAACIFSDAAAAYQQLQAETLGTFALTMMLTFRVTTTD